MRRRDGFTLIELLLVLAIIGIVSAIAVPSLLSQRARARDKAAITNVVGHLGDLVGQYDRAREAGLDPTAIEAALGVYLVQTVGNLQSPWGGNPAFNTTPRPVTGATTKAEFETAMTPNAFLGKARIYVQHPEAGVPGYLGMVTQLSQTVDGSTVFRKSAMLD